ncbi:MULTISPECIES: hypothetical protein [unclassified Moraxella]|uniref:hypothetical protein n=1 Tax=unclassified Moraxella TaxID=2685852 RepID=UPI00359EF57B
MVGFTQRHSLIKFASITLTILAVTLTGCATTNIVPQYISPNNYTTHDCHYLQSEVARVSILAEKTQNQQISLSSTGIGIGITGGHSGIYPTISFGVGSGSSARTARTNTLARLYGEHDAMLIAARQKNCAFAQNIKIYGEK